MNAKLFAILTAVLIFLFIVDLIRRQKMTFRYSLFWLISSGAVLCLGFSDRLLSSLSHLAGFEILSNFLFFVALVFFLVLCLILTVYINEQNSRTETLAQSLGILEYKLEKLQQDRKAAG